MTVPAKANMHAMTLGDAYRLYWGNGQCPFSFALAPSGRPRTVMSRPSGAVLAVAPATRYECRICGRSEVLETPMRGFHYCHCLGNGQPTRMIESVTARAIDKALRISTPKIEAYGVKGLKSKSWRKVFKNAEALNAWAEANDAEVYGTREAEGL